MDTLLQPRIQKLLKTFRRIEKLRLFRSYTSQLTKKELYVLMNIYFQNNTLSISQLSDLLNVNHSSAIQLVNALEKHQLITRQSSTTDKRVTVLAMTTNGTQLAQTIHQSNLAIFDQLIAQYGESIEETIESMNRMIDIIESMPLNDIHFQTSTDQTVTERNT